MSTLEAVDHLLLGREFETSVKVTGVASALFVVVFLLRLLAVFGPLPVATEAFDGAVLGLALIAAAVGAYVNDGLFVSVALGAAFTMGFYLPYAFSRIFHPHRSALAALGLGVGYAVVFGALGFLVGAGGRRLVETVRS